MKKDFQIPQVVVIRYSKENVITSSGGYATKGVYGAGGWTDFSSEE